jgi:hypothetical protein
MRKVYGAYYAKVEVFNFTALVPRGIDYHFGKIGLSTTGNGVY